MRLNRTENPINRIERQKINQNWDKIESDFNNVVDVISEEALDKVIDSAKIIWQEPVDNFAALATTYPNPEEGWGSMTRNDGKVWRWNGTEWKEVLQIDAGPVNALDTRLSAEIDLKADKTDINNLAYLKADITYVDGLISGITTLKPRGVFYSIAALNAAFPNGDDGFYIVYDTTFTDGAHSFVWSASEHAWKDTGLWQGFGIADDSVSPQKTTYLKESTNLFDTTDYIPGYNLDNTTGALVPNPQFNVTQFIIAKPSTLYTSKFLAKIVFYNANKVRVGYASGTNFTSPVNTAYARCVFELKYINITQLNEGGTLLPYEPYYLKSAFLVSGEEIIDLNVTSTETDFIETSTNLYYSGSATQQTSINAVDGLLVTNALTATSDFIKVTETNYVGTNIKRIGYYNKYKTILSTADFTSNVVNFTKPSNCEYVRLVLDIYKYDTSQLNAGSDILPYEEYSLSLKHSSLELKNLKFIESNSTNLLNVGDAEKGYNIDNATGNLVVNDKFAVSNYIPVKPSTAYSTSWVPKVARYDANLNYLGVTTNTTFTTAANVAFLRCVFEPAWEFKSQLNEGPVLLDYEPFSYTMNGVNLQPFFKETMNSFSSTDMITYEGPVDGIYSSDVIPDMSATLRDMTTTEMIDLYDELVTDYPNYVTKTLLGNDSLGEGIYKYEFKSTPVPTDSASNNVKTPKVILISGIHGDEKAAIYSMYQAFKAICEKWGQNELLETLRWNVHFIVVPIVNNYGFNNNLRKNENGVDLARNFPEGWVASAVGDITYGGVTPLDQLGAQYIATLLQSNKDAIYFGSFHNFFTNPNPNYFIWNASATTLQINLGKRLVSKMSRKWKKQYSWLPQDDTTYFGYADNQSPGGSESKYAASLGVQSGTIEVCEIFQLESGAVAFDSLALTMGTETLINWILLNVKWNVEFYNNRK